MQNPMFCYQCEQTAGGKGCTKMGVCGKTPEIAALQDLLIYQLKGISCYADNLLEKKEKVDEYIIKFVEDVLFTTLTNVNFDAEVHVKLLEKSQEIKDNLREKADKNACYPEEATYNLSSAKSDMLKDAEKAGIMYNQNLDADIRSLRSTIIYGLKGVSAYAQEARDLGFQNEQVNNFFYKALKSTTDDTLSLEDMIRMTIRTGEIAVEVMKVLDEAHTTKYENPEPNKVNVHVKKGPFIIVSGHNLHDLEMLLEQTKDKGINIYTHGEMLPAHGYPSLKKYKNLVGNFGGAWQEQQKEFDDIPGCILMTTNCLMKPRESYKDRLFTTSVVGWDGVQYIEQKSDGTKDFTPIIEKALELGGFDKDEDRHEILVGFAHKATLSHAEDIIRLVKEGKIKHFFLIGGCDGARTGRNYYTDFAKMVPEDCIILTLACGKYRFNKLEFGDIEGIPRLLDVGQCNDAYSAVRIALALSDAFETDINHLPLSFIISWYEQKAVAVLLALLSLGVRDIYLGPSLPAFISPNVLQYLVDTFNIKAISTPEDDLKSCLNQNV
ncbi:hydroxylamine reductase [Sedimentibacter sp. zth1]|uniref:hydroxylamine reductase n=1 Tax=Sedimentibacter sp. zth1 TaxID=2816908 RepID=UPI001A938BB0|nr:hydroxylamine reductase [Sedimentibacter sp. zth1]QSX05758.1 hydroxylamine reductase [Sedimentibacter sp. zth1]